MAASPTRARRIGVGQRSTSLTERRAMATFAIGSASIDRARLALSRRDPSAHVASLTSSHEASRSKTVRPAARVGCLASRLLATRIASRFVPRTVRLACVGRPRSSRPLKTRTSHTPGRRWRTVATAETVAVVGMSRDAGLRNRSVSGFTVWCWCVRSANETAGQGLRDVHTADAAGDDKALDLRGALEDRVDLRVAVPAFDGILADVAVAAEDLDGLLGDPHGSLAGEELGHGALAALELLGVAAHPACPPNQQTGGVDARLHVGQLEGDGLVLDDRPVELLALLGVVERVLVGGPGDADGLGPDGGASRLERRHGRLGARRLA